MREVNKIPLSERSEWQCCLAANWFIANFVHKSAIQAQENLEQDNVATPSMKPCKNKNKSKGKAPAPMQIVVEGSHKATANPNMSSMCNPMQLSSPEEWAAYLASSSEAKTPLAGVYWCCSDRAISMCALQGCLLVMSRRPTMPANTPLHVTVGYYLLAAEVILWPKYYNNLVTSGQITIATETTVPPVAFGDSFNATLLSVARFFVEQGLTVTDIEDTVFYAANWVYLHVPSNSDIIFAANALHASFTSNVCLPLGYNKDYWVPGVGIVPGPTQVINAKIHNNTVSNTASSSNTGASAMTMSSAPNATPVVANNSAGAAPSAAAPTTPMSAEAIQQMDET
ncbi:hypothetical protein BDP27DRAFT_1430509 [Rhodocollybia butyracea]|uniref:Uncharacterized protein n=1 Tax=Rhodocollybia butyracea TaxID=206335 RepID=A0A9P5TZ80_9AGAR|nr:hypothetical protein BDP27DRAFT_1430509 [Rhodocollybia butyracea]